MNSSNLFRRTMSMVLCIIMALSLVAMPISADELEETLGEIASVLTLSEGEAAPLSATEEETIYVIAGSDYQGTGDDWEKDTSIGRAKTVAALTHRLSQSGINPYGVLFCGDYTRFQTYDGSTNMTQDGIGELNYYVKNNLTGVKQIVYVQGNHDRQEPIDGTGLLSTSGAHDTPHYGVWVLNNNDYGWTADGNMAGDVENKIKPAREAMREYLKQKVAEGYTKPIFIAAHIPLHYSYRTRAHNDGQNARYIFNVLNEYGAKGLNIIYLFGHNHTAASDNYIGGGAAYLDRGDTIYVSQTSSVSAKPAELTLNFTYMNAGYLSYVNNTNPGGNVSSMAVFEITGDTVRIKRYSVDGMVPVRAKGTLYHPGSPNTDENPGHYGLTEAEMNAYMNRSYETVTVLPVNDNGNMGVKVEQPKYKTAYYQTTRFVDTHTYVIATYGDAASDNIRILREASAGNVSSYKESVEVNSRGYYIELDDTSIANQFEWYRTGGNFAAGGKAFGPLQNNNTKRYLQVDEGGSNGLTLSVDAATPAAKLRTTREINTAQKIYFFYDSTARTAGSHIGKPSGLAALVGNGAYDNRNHILSTTDYTGWAYRKASGPNGSCPPTYIYSKVNDHYDPSESSWIWAEGRSEYHLVTGQIGSWTKLKTLIQSELRVVKETNGKQSVISNYTLQGTADPTKVGTYTLHVDYNGQTLAVITVDVVDAAEAFRPEKSTVDPNFGSVYQNADGGTDTGAVLTLRFSNGAEIEVPVLVSMLQNADGTAVDTSKLGTYENLKVVYKDNYTICEDFTLYVADKNYPVYPNPGSVKVDKSATGMDFQNTGAAQVELSATGVPKIGGIDVIVMVDTSSSMGVYDDQSESRLERTHNAVNNLIDALKENVTEGKIADAQIAIADFNDYRVTSSAADYEDQPWGYYALSEINYIKDDTNNTGKVPTAPKDYTVHGTRTGTDDPLDMSAKAFVDVMQLNNNGLKWANNNTLPIGSGTNFDFAFDAIYQLGYNIKKRNEENGLTDRELIVVFMSDGCPWQFNYYQANSDDAAWNTWLNGSTDTGWAQSNVNDPGKAYYWNSQGKHWMAEAIKGDPGKYYNVIRKSNKGLESAFKDYTKSGSKPYTGKLPGLGATMYAVGLALVGDDEVTENTIVSVMKRIATTEKHYYGAVSQDELDTAFQSFVGDMVNAANNAYYLDTMGKDYDLYTSNVIMKSDGEESGTVPTIQALEYSLKDGVRTGSANVLETITFGTSALNAADETKVEVTIKYKENPTDTTFKTSTVTSFKMGEVLKGNRIWYNTSKTETVAIDPDGDGTTIDLPPETFYYYVGSLPGNKEYALSYPVYLTDALDDNDDNDAVSAGVYPTNESAALYYNNYLGNPCQKDTVSPKLPWETAQVSYCFYLVDENGNIIRNQETGALTTDFNNRVAITNPVVYDTVDLNTSGDLLSSVLSKDVLPAGYDLFVSDGVGYSVEVNSGEGGGSWTITANDSKDTTYVTGFNGNAYSNETSSNDEYDYSNTTVWFAVVANVGCVPDTVVVDFGLPVTVDVIANDLMIGTNGILKGIGKDKPAYSKPTDSSNQTLESGYGSELKKETNDLKYGDASVSDGKVVYSLQSMEMKAQETFYYGLQYTGSVGAKGYYYGEVNVIPATIIYYEDNFLEYHAFALEGDSEVALNKVWDSTDNISEEQSQDRPGEYSFPELDANNIYGYDPAYTYSIAHQNSLEGRYRAKVTEKYYGTAEFDFWGTGFDVVSICYRNTGTLLVSVYDKAQYDAAEGNTAQKMKALEPVAVQMVDTYWGYKFENGAWVPVASGAALYQIPVIKMELEEYGNYTAVITASYAEFLDHLDYGYSYLYVDAIRIYDPADDGKDNQFIEDAYVADGEGWPTYHELRNIILDAKSFSQLENDAYSKGVVYIDGKTSLNEGTGSGVNQEEGMKPGISDYYNFGPNNELYLRTEQGISFDLTDDSNIDSIHIAVKKIQTNGQKTTYVKIYDADKTYSTAESITIDTLTDLYYDISHLKGKTVVIYNSGSYPISITNIKITHKSDPNGTGNASYEPFTVTKKGAAMALASLDLPSINDQTPGVTEPIPATVVNKWNIVLGDDIGANFYVEAPEDMIDVSAVKVTVAGHTEIYDLYALTPNEEGLYKIPVNVAAAQMTEDITLQMVADGEEYTAVSYTVQDYAKTILAGDYSDATKNLVKHMLDYGAAAQNYFGVKTDDLANAGNEIAYTAQYPAEYPQQTVTGKIEGVRFYGASAVFVSKVALRYYFEADSVEGVTFSVNGVNYPAVEKNGKFYVEVPSIAPYEYGESIVLSAQKDGQQLQVSYSPLTYMVRMSQKGQPALQALMNAMYGYYEAAIAYEQQAD